MYCNKTNWHYCRSRLPTMPQTCSSGLRLGLRACQNMPVIPTSWRYLLHNSCMCGLALSCISIKYCPIKGADGKTNRTRSIRNNNARVSKLIPHHFRAAIILYSSYNGTQCVEFSRTSVHSVCLQKMTKTSGFS